ncbi:MAG TPA: hypothetical protein VF081_02635 [Solirubrobacterales bacterium]
MDDSHPTAAALRREKRELAQIERKEPLRRRLLVALGKSPSTPTDLAKAVGTRTASVGRKLAEMLDEGLLATEKGRDDRRLTIYSLTPEGQSELGRHLAFGAPTKLPPRRNEEEVAKFLREALAGAVALRRRRNRLQDSIDRLEEILAQARELKADEIALEALAELATTQRQSSQQLPLKRSLGVLETIALGTPDVRADLVLPAIAHLEYERGRIGELRGEDLAPMAQHLNAAISLFGQLVDHRPAADTRALRTRQAWSVVGLARNLRRQSQYVASLRYAAQALEMFDELEDDYGRVQCLYLFGFGLRQLRRFDEAWSCLDRAHKIAADPGQSFERARASCLMQMGDVSRHRGDTDKATDLLGEAVELADHLDLVLTRAFATSAIGAVEYQKREFQLAQQTLGSAQGLFEQCGHPEGTALNARRQATVARRLLLEDFKMSVSEVRVFKRLLRSAERSYREIGSAAGVAACEVERGWMGMLEPDCGSVGQAIKQLNRILSNNRAWRSLKGDAWFPEVFRSFARQANDEELVARAKGVYSAAKEQFEESGNQGLEYVLEATGPLETTKEVQAPKLAIEMGGESRLKDPPVAVAA